MKLFLMAILALAASAGTAPTHSGRTWTAASASRADVKEAIDSAKKTDYTTVIIPSGTATWTGTQICTLTTNISIVGAGTRATRGAGATAPALTNGTTYQGYYYNPLFAISPTSNKKIRVSNIYFNATIHNAVLPGVQINGSVSNAFALTQIRVDHCTFNFGGRALYVIGQTYGVDDHNIFLNNDVAIGFKGDDNYAWKRTIAAGTSLAWFSELDSFCTDANYGVDHLDQFFYHQQGMRTVQRYCSFTTVNYTAGAGLFIDSHGNWSSSSMLRGQPIEEIYHNTFAAYTTYQYAELRGGSVLVHDNKYTYVTSAANPFQLWEEEAWTSGGPWCPSCPYSARWPAMDQINNSFFWNDTLNSSVITDATLKSSVEVPYIVKDRDYFMHAPAASGGSESWPDSAGSMNMTFTAGVQNYYPYTPFVYPHPLSRALQLIDTAYSVGANGFSIIVKANFDTIKLQTFVTTDTASWGAVRDTKYIGPFTQCTSTVSGVPSGKVYTRLITTPLDYSALVSPLDTFSFPDSTLGSTSPVTINPIIATAHRNLPFVFSRSITGEPSSIIFIHNNLIPGSVSFSSTTGNVSGIIITKGIYTYIVIAKP